MKTIPIFSFLLMSTLIACQAQQQESASSESTQTTPRAEKPIELGMEQDSLDAQVQQRGVDKVEEETAKLVEEAASAIEATYEAVAALSRDKKDSALMAIERATGKLEVLLARDPSLSMIPLDVSLKTEDLVADLPTIDRIKETVEQAIEDGYYQVARQELENLASEIQITTVEMPLATYPEAMKAAAALIEENQLEAANLVLYDALNTLVVVEERIPLPVLRAEALVENAQKLDAESEDKKEDVLMLLGNAKFQLVLAEELGYGKRDKEYEELSESIEELEESVRSEGDSQGIFSKLKDKISSFADRIS